MRARHEYSEEPRPDAPLATLHMRVDNEEGVLCERLVVEPRSADKPLTAQRLRAIPFGAMVQRAPLRATRPITDWGSDARRQIRVRPLNSDITQKPAWLLEDPAKSTHGALADGWQDMSAEELAAAVRELHERPVILRELTDDDQAAAEAAIKRPRRRRQPLSDEQRGCPVARRT
jgi:hypothetical protein